VIRFAHIDRPRGNPIDKIIFALILGTVPAVFLILLILTLADLIF
jgi:hypothetical protein